MTQLSKHLVVGDPHARPDNDMRRFDALANFIIDKRPEHVIIIGDLADMASLSSYDKGTIHAEGRRYMRDIEAAQEAVRRIMGPVNAYCDRLRSGHKRRYEPKFHITMGNHEYRIERACAENPHLAQALSYDDLGYAQAGWNVVPFLKPLVLDQIAYQHYFTSGVMGRPIGGDNHAANLVKKGFMSAVCGHSHMRDYWETVDVSGRKRFGLVAGCYDSGDHHYTHEGKRWWSGLTMLHEVHDGQAEPAFFSIDYVLRKYT